MGNRSRRSRLLACLVDRDGGAGVEFAILGPILALVLAGIIDLGGVVFVKFRLDNAVSAAANYAIVDRGRVTEAEAANLASAIATILTNSGSENLTGSVTVNNGPAATLTNGAVAGGGGVASNAGNCYCPTLAASSVDWGGPVTCGNDCGGGGKAGKFVSIEASRPYTPLFANYGLVSNRSVSARAMIQVD